MKKVQVWSDCMERWMFIHSHRPGQLRLTEVLAEGISPRAIDLSKFDVESSRTVKVKVGK